MMMVDDAKIHQLMTVCFASLHFSTLASSYCFSVGLRFSAYFCLKQSIIIVNFLLLAIYYFFKIIVQVCLRVYYPDTHIRHPERLKLSGPTLVVSNHPNTLSDPLQVAIRLNRQVFFLANASVFKSAITNWLFRTLYCIPIKRPSDDTGRQEINNEDSFLQSYEHLARGGNIYIAPEGGSETLRKLHPLKKGTARIGLGAEAAHAFSLGVSILPVGLNYTRPRRFGEGLVIEVGQPLRVADWQKAYQADPVEAAHLLTEALEAQLHDLVYLHATDDEQDQLLHRLEDLHQHDSPLDAPAFLKRSQTLLAYLQQMQTQAPQRYDAFMDAMEVYYNQFRAAHLTDLGIASAGRSLGSPVFWLGWPLWLYGWVNHLIAYQSPRCLWRKLQLYPTYASTVKIMVGLLSFPLAYGLQYGLAGWLLPAPWPLLYLLSLPLSGWLAWRYAQHARPLLAGWHYRRWKANHPEAAAQLEQMRRNILSWPVE